MPERREIDKMLRGLTPKHQRQLSVSSSNALERFAVVEVRERGEKLRAETRASLRECRGFCLIRLREISGLRGDMSGFQAAGRV